LIATIRTSLLFGFGCGAGGGDDYRLGVEELAHAGGGELAAVAGVFDAAEGQARIAGDHGVEEDAAALQFGDEALLLGGVARPGGGAEAEGGVVGELDRFVEIFDAEEHGYGSEELLAVDRGGAGDADEDGGFEVVTFADHAFAAGEDAGARGLCGLDLGFEDIDGALAGSRLRGRVALTLDDQRNVEGEVGLDTLDLASAFELARIA